MAVAAILKNQNNYHISSAIGAILTKFVIMIQVYFFWQFRPLKSTNQR